MNTRESNGETDYIYFPIEYTTRAAAVELTPSIFPGVEETPKEVYITWFNFVDNAKILCGITTDHNGQGINLSLLSAGF